jgi:hypothetical protein
MRKVHTLTYNETTYNINDGEVKNDIFINGVKSGWYIEYESRNLDDILVRTSIKLKYHEDTNSFDHYLAINTTSLQFHNIVEIIQTIKQQ